MKIPFGSANLLLPKQEMDLQKWAVVACDQYTSEPEYWKEVENFVGDAPSTCHMILPEVYLKEKEEEERLLGIRNCMEQYLKEDIFRIFPDAMIYVERTDSTGALRAGIVGAIDLEEYDYHKGSRSAIRATEATVLERIPPRVRIRKQALLELPHVMLLVDDPKKTVIEPLAERQGLSTVYDFDLMQGGGHLKGKLLGKEEQEEVLAALGHLEEAGEKEGNSLLFAVGDGNHSLASARECYEELKASDPGKDFSHHPARYALVEVVNLHSPALQFEPIHRMVTGVDPAAFLLRIKEELGLKEGEQDAAEESGSGQKITVVRKGQETPYRITKPSSGLTVGSLQNAIDAVLKEQKGSVDYIHGREVIRNLSMEENSVGFLLPVMKKEELFPTVLADGALPRKTFSMGHAADKRFYMECRKITE